jgi:hypothetical protein
VVNTWADAVGMNDEDEPAPVDLAAFVPASPLTLPAIPPGLVLRGDGPEPPLHVQRLRAMDDAVSMDVCRRSDHRWWWIDRDMPTPNPSDREGWEWGNVERSFRGPWLVTEVTNVFTPATVDQEQPGAWRFDGPEPPPGVVRLRHRPDALKHLARAADGKWSFVTAKTPNPARGAFEWDSRLPDSHVFTPVLPAMDSLIADMTGSLALALPPDGEWYRIGTWKSGDADLDGEPVWGTLHTDGDWDACRSPDNPEGS